MTEPEHRYWSTANQKWIYPTWKVEYSNDVGPNDEGFWEWWEVTNGQVTFKADAEKDAEWLCAVLNGDTPE